MADFSGHLAILAAARADGRTVLAAQSFRAPYHLSKPYWDTDARTLLVQVVNPTAGILSGDRLESKISVEAGASLMATTPSASRVFKMKDGRAECRQHFDVGPGGWLEVLPEPLVPHRGSTYHQVTQIDVAPGGGLFFVDQLMPGRVAHGEAWEWSKLILETNLRIGGELILRERFDQTGTELKALSVLAGSGPTACFGNALLIGEASVDSSCWLDAVRALHGEGRWLGVSSLRRDGWSIKFVARDGLLLRATVKALRSILAPHFPQIACGPRKL